MAFLDSEMAAHMGGHGWASAGKGALPSDCVSLSLRSVAQQKGAA
jgi:hypothetical protein